MNDYFSTEERRLILLYLRPDAMSRERRLWYVAYILPSALFALYAMWHRNFAAALVAYIALLFVALMYLSYNARYVPILRSILEKYEASVGALKEPS